MGDIEFFHFILMQNFQTFLFSKKTINALHLFGIFEFRSKIQTHPPLFSLSLSVSLSLFLSPEALFHFHFKEERGISSILCVCDVFDFTKEIDHR